MQHVLSIFNPENDLALANGDENYQPPQLVQKMREDLSTLPLWYKPESHYILTSSLPEPDWNREMEELFPVNSRFLLPEEVCNYPTLHPQPWGWNPMLVKQLKCNGLDSLELPSVSQLSHIRRLSHRVVAVRLLEKLQLNSCFCGRSALLTSQQEIREFAGKYAPIVLKAPYSGSGRGLFWGKGYYTEGMERWSNRILKQQGGVIGEPVFDKVEDFAMQFWSDGKGKVYFKGYSFFMTDDKGAYMGNMLLACGQIEEWLAGYAGKKNLRLLQQEIVPLLSAEIGSYYQGHFGVDMMICQFKEKPLFRILPCVEVNLRMNMGMLTRTFHDRFVRPGHSGEFFVDSFGDAAQLEYLHRKLKDAYPLRVENGKVASGYLSLTPVTSGSRFRAWVFVR